MRRVLLCGKSLFISGMHATLEEAPGLEMRLVDPNPDAIRECIREWQPDILILENDLLKTQPIWSLLIDFPWIKLIGLDIENNRLMVYSSQAADHPTTFDLLEVIKT
jgi:hypothetical protein